MSGELLAKYVMLFIEWADPLKHPCVAFAPKAAVQQKRIFKELHPNVW